ncbi:HU family DNA-binding protein [Aromatoleum bremense]|uniref:HU family DNA-binding protein n=1 Tax=Aromatoleum bremense TaxID=76115 RepID=UPI0031401AAB
MTLTKADLIQDIAAAIGLNKREAAERVEAFFEEIAGALVSGQEVKLSGFGCFQVREKRARPGRKRAKPRSSARAAWWYFTPVTSSNLQLAAAIGHRGQSVRRPHRVVRRGALCVRSRNSCKSPAE